MKGKKTGGRKKNSKNKATLEIKALLDECVNFEDVVLRLFELSQGIEVQKPTADGFKVFSQPPDSLAAKILLEYRFGKPKQEIGISPPESYDLTLKISSSKPDES